MGVVAKFYTSEITKRAYNPDHREITLAAVTRGEENREWAAATPNGSIKLTINNEKAAAFFDDFGVDYLVTFEKVERPSA